MVLSLMQLRRDRWREPREEFTEASRTFGEGFLTLDKLRVDEEKRKRDILENDRDYGIDLRSQDESEAAGRATRARQYDTEVRNQEIHEANQKIAQENARREAAGGIAKAAVAAGHTTPEDFYANTPEMAGIADIGRHESPRLEIEEALATEAAEAQGLGLDAYKAQTGRMTAEAAGINARRPRQAPQFKPPQPKGLGEVTQRQVGDDEAAIEKLNFVLAEVESGRADPGLVSHFGTLVRQAIGQRGVDDAAFMQLNSVLNTDMHNQYGAALSAHEMANFLKAAPAFKDNNEAFLALTKMYRANLIKHRQSRLDTARRNDEARGAPWSGDPFPQYDPQTGQPAQPAPAPAPKAPSKSPKPKGAAIPPQNPGETRRQYFTRLLNTPGVDQEAAMKAVMGLK